MAVYARTYRSYAGPFVSERARLFVLTRYGLADLFRSKAFLALFVLCFVPTVVAMVRIYLAHNAEFLDMFNVPSQAVEQLLAISGSFFRGWVLVPAAVAAFWIALFGGASLVSPDFRNNAMPLYLARPLSRSEYLAGKLLALLIPMCAVTLAPALLLFGLQCLFAGAAWIGDYAWVGASLVVAILAWNLVIALFSLALAAWVKWRPVARLLMIALPLLASAFGHAANGIFGTTWGLVLSFWSILGAIWESLLRLPENTATLSAGTAWVMLTLVGLASLGLFYRRIKAYEVER
ncbi:MAG TPA: hypothetical protein VF017_05565 [Thermoanaerobaculia bacterium]|nr:hypothetical protein [Thermoanaerobaculia bacterium]